MKIHAFVHMYLTQDKSEEGEDPEVASGVSETVRQKAAMTSTRELLGSEDPDTMSSVHFSLLS